MRILVIDPGAGLTDEMRDWPALPEVRVTDACSATETLERLRGNEYDAALLNFALPDSRGLELILAIRQSAAGLPLVVISQPCWIEVKLTALALGADDFIMRPCEPEEVLGRLLAVCRRVPQTDDDIRVGRLRLHKTVRRASVNGRPLALTGREFDVLALLASNRGSVVSQQMLWRHLYDSSHRYDSTKPAGRKIISGFVRSLRRKLEQAGCPAMIGTSQGRGYLLACPVRDAATWPRTTVPAADTQVHGW